MTSTKPRLPAKKSPPSKSPAKKRMASALNPDGTLSTTFRAQVTLSRVLQNIEKAVGKERFNHFKSEIHWLAEMRVAIEYEEFLHGPAAVHDVRRALDTREAAANAAWKADLDKVVKRRGHRPLPTLLPAPTDKTTAAK